MITNQPNKANLAKLKPELGLSYSILIFGRNCMALLNVKNKWNGYEQWTWPILYLVVKKSRCFVLSKNRANKENLCFCFCFKCKNVCLIFIISEVCSFITLQPLVLNYTSQSTWLFPSTLICKGYSGPPNEHKK